MELDEVMSMSFCLAGCDVGLWLEASWVRVTPNIRRGFRNFGRGHNYYFVENVKRMRSRFWVLSEDPRLLGCVGLVSPHVRMVAVLLLSG